MLASCKCGSPAPVLVPEMHALDRDKLPCSPSLAAQKVGQVALESPLNRLSFLQALGFKPDDAQRVLGPRLRRAAACIHVGARHRCGDVTVVGAFVLEHAPIPHILANLHLSHYSWLKP
jgi:hypothetical protein